jgi:glycosyltransferase involved in cell wall biosynthesis
MKKMQIAILLGTYNGEKFLREQLESFKTQSNTDWVLWASDDGSTDRTIDIVRQFAVKVGLERVHHVSGPKKGFAKNFLALVCNPDLIADAYAYADQDDIWMADKLERAVHFFRSVPSEMPALYCSRTQYVDQLNNNISLSLPYSKPPVFANALIQNIASGNTMVFNDAARSLIIRAGQDVNIDLHDWWTYMLVTGAGGKVFFDQQPSVRYRQHPNNLWGMNTSFRAQMMRIQKLFGGRFQGWNEQHTAALKPMQNLLTPGNQIVFEQFSKARKQSLVPRLLGLKRSGVYRQTALNNLGFFLAALVGKV